VLFIIVYFINYSFEESEESKIMKLIMKFELTRDIFGEPGKKTSKRFIKFLFGHKCKNKAIFEHELVLNN